MEIINYQPIQDEGLQICNIRVDDAYLKEWNERCRDFVVLAKNGKLISNNLYRIGGLNNPNPKKDRYFMLIKYTEDIYDYDFIKGCYPNMNSREQELHRKHLASSWVIIDRNGIEKAEFKNTIHHAYLIEDTILYTFNGSIYNIETNERICCNDTVIKLKDYILVESKYDYTDKSKIGVFKINKHNGSFEKLD